MWRSGRACSGRRLRGSKRSRHCWVELRKWIRKARFVVFGRTTESEPTSMAPFHLLGHLSLTPKLLCSFTACCAITDAIYSVSKPLTPARLTDSSSRLRHPHRGIISQNQPLQNMFRSQPQIPPRRVSSTTLGSVQSISRNPSLELLNTLRSQLRRARPS